MSFNEGDDWRWKSLASYSPPNENEIAKNVLLDKWIAENAEIDEVSERRKKERILLEITATVRAWVRVIIVMTTLIFL